MRVVEYTIVGDSEQITYRLITSLIDPALFPALLIATEYHQRWEIENKIDELKTHLNGRKIPIRSLKPREVVQEIWFCCKKCRTLVDLVGDVPVAV